MSITLPPGGGGIGPLPGAGPSSNPSQGPETAKPQGSGQPPATGMSLKRRAEQTRDPDAAEPPRKRLFQGPAPAASAGASASAAAPPPPAAAAGGGNRPPSKWPVVRAALKDGTLTPSGKFHAAAQSVVSRSGDGGEPPKPMSATPSVPTPTPTSAAPAAAPTAAPTAAPAAAPGVGSVEAGAAPASQASQQAIGNASNSMDAQFLQMQQMTEKQIQMQMVTAELQGKKDLAKAVATTIANTGKAIADMVR